VGGTHTALSLGQGGGWLAGGVAAARARVLLMWCITLHCTATTAHMVAWHHPCPQVLRTLNLFISTRPFLPRKTIEAGVRDPAGVAKIEADNMW
jgi:hypothetical protein